MSTIDIDPPTPNAYKASFYFVLLIFTITFLQKVGISAGASAISLSTPVLYISLLGLAFRRRLILSRIRLTFFLLFVVASFLSQAMVTGPFSITSLGFLIALYLPFIFICEMDRSEWLATMRVFQNVMIPIAGMVFVQAVAQVALHLKIPSLEPLLPRALLMPGYLYEGHLHYGQPYVRPNGFFMLEPSFLSAFAACALIVEIAIFRRFGRALWFGAAIFVSTGATGLVILAFAAPLLLIKERPAVMIATLGAAAIGVVVLVATGSIDSVSGRISELGVQNSSGSQRLVAPLMQLQGVIQDPSSILFGAGAGTITGTASSWPLVKLAYEYGFLTMMTFMAFLVTCFINPPIAPAALGLFVVYNFVGGYLLTPILPVLIFFMVAVIRVKQPLDVPQRASRLDLNYPLLHPISMRYRHDENGL
jgi:hypothetical protein